jgi:hypothetical protein
MAEAAMFKARIIFDCSLAEAQVPRRKNMKRRRRKKKLALLCRELFLIYYINPNF